jgi:hypothetical protein
MVVCVAEERVHLTRLQAVCKRWRTRGLVERSISTAISARIKQIIITLLVLALEFLDEVRLHNQQRNLQDSYQTCLLYP